MKVTYTKVPGKQHWRVSFFDLEEKLHRDIQSWVNNTHHMVERDAHRHSVKAMPCIHYPVGPNDRDLVIELQSAHEVHQEYVVTLKRFVSQHVHQEVVIENF